MSVFVVVAAIWTVTSISTSVLVMGALRVTKHADHEAERLLAREAAIGREGVVRELPVVGAPRARV
jgi:hypothetical protein